MAHTRLTAAERHEIGILVDKGYGVRDIARALGRSPNTVSYELRCNSVDGVYVSTSAQTKATNLRKTNRRGWMKLEQHPHLKKLVIEKLEAGWGPDEIAGWLRKEGKTGSDYVSKTSIYDWLRSVRGERYCIHLYSRRKVVRPRLPQTAKVMIPERVSVAARSDAATTRTEAGHHERDTMVSHKGAPGGLSTGIERVSRLLMATIVVSMSPAEHAAVVVADAKRYRTVTVTYDNGIENRNHVSTGIPSFFCDPYSSWQKGSIENANKMLRRYFPKGTDFSRVTQDEVDRVVRRINEKPRKILGYRSAFEVARELGIIYGESVLLRG